MSFRYIFLSLALLSFTSSLFAQKKKVEEIKIEAVSGVAFGSNTESLQAVKQKALSNAKTEAIKQAGIEENINAYSQFFRSETEEKMEELFVSDVLSNIRGNVKDIKELEVKRSFTDEGLLKIELTISCTVLKYLSQPDLQFSAAIEGIKQYYTEGDSLKFSIKPSLPAYVHAFMFTTESFQLLPNSYEPLQPLSPMDKNTFPSPGIDIDYILDAGGQQQETNRLVIVLTKEKTPYLGAINYTSITEWIMAIPPDEKIVESFSFAVVKQ